MWKKNILQALGLSSFIPASPVQAASQLAQSHLQTIIPGTRSFQNKLNHDMLSLVVLFPSPHADLIK